MAGGDGSQALVASVAMRHGVPHVVRPGGTRNHFALDLGLDRDDVVGALDAFADGVERRDRPRRRSTAGSSSTTRPSGSTPRSSSRPSTATPSGRPSPRCCPSSSVPTREPLDLRFTGPTARSATARVILVSNDPYELHSLTGRGTRERARRRRARHRRAVRSRALGRAAARRRCEPPVSSTASTGGASGRPKLRVRSGGPVEVGVDGEALTLDPPSCSRRDREPCVCGSPGVRPACRRPPPRCTSRRRPPSASCSPSRPEGRRRRERTSGRRQRRPTPSGPRRPSGRLPTARRPAGVSAAAPADRVVVRLLRELAAVDTAVYRAIAATPTPVLDGPLRVVTSAADHSKLWLGASAALFARWPGAAEPRSPALRRSGRRRRS